MARTIRVEPAVLETTAARIEQQAADYERIYRQLYAEVDGMGAAWQGTDNQAFVTQIKGFTDDFQKMATLMKQYAEYLRLSAKTYRETQNEVINHARRLTN
ncbi:WXG100 family type VII secretion target [Alkalihalobacterium elongatum]|uniref:WXG100 family type VII secretion target n=1 Tax=Alkalihalobacterium elongatum TaxID=2675466 RepID=UPI001C200053|nr:WXG100 family type VII secretion target [Alkalihalobacterium elongatum]